MQSIQQNLAALRQRIEIVSPQRSKNVQILAVSKRQSEEKIRQAHALGLSDVGENYLQEALDKQQMLADLPLNWHFIGRIQSNKTRPIAEHFDWVHSLSRESIARRLNEQRPTHLPPLQVCIQVNIDDDNAKAGIRPDDLPALAAAIGSMKNLKLRGLMTMPRADSNDAELLQTFNTASNLLDALRPLAPDVDTLSMGMSKDLEIAVRAGATILRVGEALFGPRTN